MHGDDTVVFEERLLRAKLDAMKELAYGASHEINNPLANISARAQSLLRDETDPERQRALKAIHEQAMRAHEMISDLMLFARPPRLEVAKVAPADLIEQAARRFEPGCRDRGVALAVQVDPESPPIEADAQQLQQALEAVVRNSIEAVDDGGSVTILAASKSRAAADGPSPWLRIEVCDSGVGFSPTGREHAFDPFFSGREAGRGLGFGLSKCWRVVTDHGGSVTAENLRGGGARIVIELPATVRSDAQGSGTVE